jgi:hypothetical protein
MYIIRFFALKPMPRGLLLCTTIVAAFELHLAAASSNVVDAPVAPAVAALAARIGLDPAREAARFVPEITRILYSPGEGKQPLLELLRSPRANAVAEQKSSESDVRVPLPFAAETWSRAIFHRPVAERALLTTILADRRAALVCRGLFGLDDETLDYFADHPLLLTMIYEQGAPAFGAFADAFHVSAGRVVPKGGATAAALWEAVLREPLSAPDRVARALFVEVGGRRAYTYWTIAASNPHATAFALGAWIGEADVRLRRCLRRRRSGQRPDRRRVADGGHRDRGHVLARRPVGCGGVRAARLRRGARRAEP